jgi:hypothetical protein
VLGAGGRGFGVSRGAGADSGGGAGGGTEEAIGRRPAQPVMAITVRKKIIRRAGEERASLFAGIRSCTSNTVGCLKTGGPAFSGPFPVVEWL